MGLHRLDRQRCTRFEELRRGCDCSKASCHEGWAAPSSIRASVANFEPDDTTHGLWLQLSSTLQNRCSRSSIMHHSCPQALAISLFIISIESRNDDFKHPRFSIPLVYKPFTLSITIKPAFYRSPHVVDPGDPYKCFGPRPESSHK